MTKQYTYLTANYREITVKAADRYEARARAEVVAAEWGTLLQNGPYLSVSIIK